MSVRISLKLAVSVASRGSTVILSLSWGQHKSLFAPRKAGSGMRDSVVPAWTDFPSSITPSHTMLRGYGPALKERHGKARRRRDGWFQRQSITLFGTSPTLFLLSNYRAFKINQVTGSRVVYDATYRGVKAHGYRVIALNQRRNPVSLTPILGSTLIDEFTPLEF